MSEGVVRPGPVPGGANGAVGASLGPAGLELLALVAREVEVAASLEIALQQVLTALCEFTGSPVGHVYRVEGGTRLVPTELWSFDGRVAVRALQEAVAAESLDRTDALAGRAWAAQQAAVVPLAPVATAIRRAGVARASGLERLCVLPVSADSGGAVFELFAQADDPHFAVLLTLAPLIGAQLGRAYDRAAGEAAVRSLQTAHEQSLRERTESLSRVMIALNERVQELSRLEHKLEVRDRAIAAAPNGIVIVDALAGDWPLVYVNPAFERITGYPAGEVLGRNLRFLGGPDRDDESRSRLRDAVRHGMGCEVILRNYRKDGTHFWNQLTIAPVRDSNGLLTHFVGIQQDVTAEREAADLLRAAKAKADEANAHLSRAARLKDEFLAAMSHELRTPLNGILGLTQSLQEGIYGALPAPQRNAVDSIDESSRHLLELINDILDLSKIEAGKLTLEPEDVDVELVAQASLRVVRELAKLKRIRLNLGMLADAPFIRADARRVKQVLVNLLSNAVKFTPEGGTVGIEVRSHPAEPAVVFEVSDTGIGIAPADVPKLFQSFVQIDSRLARRYEGTGLGLALVKRLTELHGGTVSVQSEPGHGSKFTVKLPIGAVETMLRTSPAGASAPAPAAPTAAETRAVGRRVLLAEDHQLNQQVFREYLEAHGHRVVLVEDGAQAVDAFAREAPDIVLMDVQMPGMDGLEATRRIRSLPGGERVPIIALTALAMAGDAERCLAAGMNRYLSKPVSLRELAAEVATLAGGDSGLAPDASRPLNLPASEPMSASGESSAA